MTPLVEPPIARRTRKALLSEAGVMISLGRGPPFSSWNDAVSRVSTGVGLSTVLWVLALLIELVATSAAELPDGYYATVDTSTAPTLRTTLHAVIDDHTRYPYTSSATDSWDILTQADQNPADTTHILDVYRNASYPTVAGGNDNYNREHTWPSSYGFPRNIASNYPYTDSHHLFLADSSYNSSRGNTAYRSCDAACTEKPTLENGGAGGGSGTFPGNSNWRSGSGSTGRWQTWVGRQGDVARALFYMDVRYEGGTHGGSGLAEPDLILTDNLALLTTTSGNVAIAHMGQLSTLLTWHAADPVDAKERARNDVVFGFQGNRNPFIDHPIWATCVFEGQCAPAFTDDPLTTGTTQVKAVHITELRTRINALRNGCGLSNYFFTDSTVTAGSTMAQAVHLTDLRTALGQAYVACGQSAPTYTDATLATGVTVITAVHIAELRAAVIALE